MSGKARTACQSTDAARPESFRKIGPRVTADQAAVRTRIKAPMRRRVTTDDAAVVTMGVPLDISVAYKSKPKCKSFHVVRAHVGV